MRNKHALFGALMGLSAFVGTLGVARADTITVHSIKSTLPNSVLTGIYQYDVEFDDFTNAQANDGFVIYDFPKLASWSFSGGLNSGQWTESSQLIGNSLNQNAAVDSNAATVASADGIVPADSSLVENLTFSWNGPPNAPFLGAASAILTLTTSWPTPETNVLGLYGSVDHSGPTPADPFSYASNAIVVPFGTDVTPEPSCVALLGIASAALMARRRRR